MDPLTAAQQQPITFLMAVLVIFVASFLLLRLVSNVIAHFRDYIFNMAHATLVMTPVHAYLQSLVRDAAYQGITHVLRDRRYPPQSEAPHAQAHQFFSCCDDRGLSYGFLGYIRCGLGLYQSRNRSAKGWVIVIHCTAAPAGPGISPDLRLIGQGRQIWRGTTA
jgi:hypothetical protein